MKVALLFCPPDATEADYAPLDPPADLARVAPEHDWTGIGLHKATVVAQLREAAKDGHDVYVNLCDGAWDEDSAGLEVVLTLERLGLPYTGAGPAFYDPSRIAMKMACHAAGIDVPAYVMARGVADVPIALERLRFPMIVKHPQGYASVGLTRASRVEDPAALTAEVDRVCGEYGAALVEEFIEGREFTVLVVEGDPGDDGPVALTPVEYAFPTGESFKHFDLKWVDWEQMEERVVADGALARRLRDVSARLFEGLGGSGYGRVDLRLTGDGALHVLEINPNCGVFYPEGAYGSADAILAADPLGHRGFLDRIIELGLERNRRARPLWEPRFTPGRGFGMTAVRPISPGEVVQAGEGRPHRLVTRTHVQRTWSPLQQAWFRQYAWPVGDEVHAIWSEDPDEWRPLNHACDPNTVMDGLDLVACRPIGQGEEVTVDYATFAGPDMEPFTCDCRADGCRGTIGAGAPGSAHEVVALERGHGLVATRPMAGGQVVSPVSWGPLTREPSRWSLQLGGAVHAEPMPRELRYINHGCDPNVLFDLAAGVVRTLRAVAPGDELRCFYPATEWEMAEPFACTCGAARCLGWVEGAGALPGAALEAHVLSEHVRERLSAQADSMS
jgi:D-alanine-D-alanine ligase